MTSVTSNDLVAFELSRKENTILLNKEIILENMKQAVKHCNTQYIMAVATSWFRANPGSNFRNLHDYMALHSLDSMILTYKSSGDYDICIPCNEDRDFEYIAVFINRMNKYRDKILKNYILRGDTEPLSWESNLERLKYAGFSCKKGQMESIVNSKKPSIDILKTANIIDQLQWGFISIDIKIVTPVSVLKSNIESAKKKYNMTPYQYTVDITIDDSNKATVDLYFVTSNNEIKFISEFGYIHSESGTRYAIHVPTYVKNYISTSGSVDSKVSKIIKDAIETFDLDKVTNITTDEKIALANYFLKKNTKLTFN